ncbi:TPT-domain-containing protein [Hanseniaspora valbyensis NRRL Y-1626]|uniref:TPT-domain-containing protein n=1 Tax=Hanseniaspora valbyensis NRRL Y-1626 TaxID=766949 RepID=A0A1B7TIZ8_9ASCO|nr:TPT-domain-containing protein [Hanseniaspora valbyensis NRRL Y-1626]
MTASSKLDRVEIIVICLCWYTTSSIASQITKQILTQCPFPLLLGEFQFLFLIGAAIITSNLAYHFKKFKNLFPNGTFPQHFDNDKKDGWKLYKDDWIIRRLSKDVVKTVLPLGIFQFVGKWFGHKATALVPISTVSSIKTTSPFFIILVQKLLRIKTKNNNMTIISLSLIIIGVLAIVKSDSKKFQEKAKAAKNSEGKIDLQAEHHNSKFIAGLLASTVSMLVFVFQNIYAKKIFTNDSKHNHQRVTRSRSNTTISDADDLDIPHSGHRRNPSLALPVFNSAMLAQQSRKTSDVAHNEKPTIAKTPANSKKYDKMTLMIYISLFGFLGSLGWFLYFELPSLLIGTYATRFNSMVVENNEIIVPWNLFFLNGFLHFIQAMITYYLLGKLQTLSYSVANLMKRIVIIVVSWVMMVDGNIGLLQISGLLLNIIGLYMYNVSKL